LGEVAPVIAINASLMTSAMAESLGPPILLAIVVI
jgi:hypothetical protein